VRRAYFVAVRAYTKVYEAIGPRFRAHSSFNQRRNKRVVGRTSRAEKEMIVMKDSKEVLEKRAEASFKKEVRAQERAKALLDYQAEGRAVDEKTARFKSASIGQGSGGECLTLPICRHGSAKL